MIPFQSDADGRSLIKVGFGGDGMSQTSADASAQIQTDAACLLVLPAVTAGVTPFKDTRQILRRNADTGVADT